VAQVSVTLSVDWRLKAPETLLSLGVETLAGVSKTHGMKDRGKTYSVKLPLMSKAPPMLLRAG
jgi:hypothetical protein